MAHVPDDLVAGRIELVEQRDGQLDHAEAGADMATGDGAALDQPVADLLGQLGKLVAAEALQVGGAVDGREQGHVVSESVRRGSRAAEAAPLRSAVITSSSLQYTRPRPPVPPTAPRPVEVRDRAPGQPLGLRPGPVDAEQNDVGGLGQLRVAAGRSCPAPRWCRWHRARRPRSGTPGRCPRR